ncbi:hypothetical protein [Paenibacillus sp. 8b26]|uniref:hypothetical protein n=1 Tax=Paenibacillus sp. 8b26 TaxID=3424133 RepID=UPI003D6514CD
MAQIRIVELNKALKNVSGEHVGVSAEELNKAEYLLSINPEMIRIIGDYEFAVKSSISLSSYESSKGYVRQTRATILKYKRPEWYFLYKTLSKIIQTTINNVINPYERTILDLLYIKGMRYLAAQSYMEKGYRSDIYPISGSTFADRRRAAIKKIAHSFQMLGLLDLVQAEYRIGELSSMQFLELKTR